MDETDSKFGNVEEGSNSDGNVVFSRDEFRTLVNLLKTSSKTAEVSETEPHSVGNATCNSM